MTKLYAVMFAGNHLASAGVCQSFSTDDLPVPEIYFDKDDANSVCNTWIEDTAESDVEPDPPRYYVKEITIE